MTADNIGIIRVGDIHSRQLELNGRRVYRATASYNMAGTYIIGNRLYDNGSLVAVSAQEKPQLVIADGIAYFGEVRLSTDGVCINITLEDYNRLYNREEVPGYKYFDPYDVYNIVDDVENASDIHYIRADGKLVFDSSVEYVDYVRSIANQETVDELTDPIYILYNNVVGEREHIAEDLQATVTKFNAPYLNVHYFNPVVVLDRENAGNNTINLHIAIDDYFASYLSKRTVTGPYTVEVWREYDYSSVVRKTVYSGEAYIRTPEFNSLGETWFSIRCIDSVGCSSAVQHLDVLVKNPAISDNFWEVTDSDLAQYDIVYDTGYDELSATQAEHEAKTLEAYKNKVGFNALFADAVENGYNGVRLPNHTYYISDYKNQSTVAGQYDFKADLVRYWKVDINDDHKIESAEECTLEDVTNDTYGLFRYGWYIDNYNDIYETIASLKVSAANPNSIPLPENPEISNKGVIDPYGIIAHKDDIIYTNDKGWSYDLPDGTKYALTYNDLPAGVRYALNLYRRYWRAYRKDVEYLAANKDNDKGLVKTDEGVLYHPGSYYFGYSTDIPECGDNLVFPSHFTLDLNGSTVKVKNQYDLGCSTGSPTWGVCVEHATDTHIINGAIDGGLSSCNFPRAVAQTAYRNPYEHAHVFTTRAARFCTFENLTIKGSLGYGVNSSYDDSAYFVRALPNTRVLNSEDIYDRSYIDIATGAIIQHPNMSIDPVNDTDIDYSSLTVVMPKAGSSNASSANSDYFDLADRPGKNYVIFGQNGYRTYNHNGFRHEIFVAFYREDGTYILTVKTKINWAVHIPNGAAKVKVMGYGYSNAIDKNKVMNSRWTGVYLWQTDINVGSVYKDCILCDTKNCMLGGEERQCLYENVKAINIASRAAVEEHFIGCWSTITSHVSDYENGGPMCKNITYNNCEFDIPTDVHYTLDGGAMPLSKNLSTRSICAQIVEFLQITNCKGLVIADWGGVESALMRNNSLNSSAHGWSVVRGQHKNHHPHVQFDDNRIIRSGSSSISYSWKHVARTYYSDAEYQSLSSAQKEEAALKYLNDYAGDTDDYTVHARGLRTDVKGMYNNKDIIITGFFSFQNTKYVNTYMD